VSGKRKQPEVLSSLEEPARKHLNIEPTMTVDNVHTFRDDSLDDSLYSRQRYVLGDFAMNQLQKAHIFLSGLGGLGVEIVKNVVLAGPKAITLHDTKQATAIDLSNQFYIKEDDIGKNRASVSAPRVAELNPYVQVHSNIVPLNVDGDLSYLDQFKCVILTDTPLHEQIKINKYCREKGIYYISADTFGAFAWAFTDFGKDFVIHDKDGEESEEVLVKDITKAEQGLVTCLENALHGLEDGDSVVFKEVQGMTELNGNGKEVAPIYKVTVKTPSQFTIGDTSKFSTYTSGGMFKKFKTKNSINFLPLSESIQQPEFLFADFAKFTVPSQLHLGNLALNQFRQSHNRLPHAWDDSDAQEIVKIAADLNAKAGDRLKVEQVDEKLLKQLSYVAEGAFSPISAFLGGFVAQEVLKCITGKFTPLNQWLYFDAPEILPETDRNAKTDTLNSRRSAGQAIVLGAEACAKLEKLKLFTVGAGAIGCEMMKNYALMGVACSKDKTGVITITDNDLIEKSNLNRQFLFRNSDLQKPKSECAARAAHAMNPAINVDAHLNRVGQQTESIYSDTFFIRQDAVVNALDNVAARMYVDSRVVANERPLFESGTLGTKGHVQVILPHKTESYSSQRDPPEKDTPFCTLKSFPNIIDHCIQWARDKFEMLFANKPTEVNKFFEEKGFLNELKSGPIKPVRHLAKMLNNRPKKFEDCIGFGRLKFQGYFANNIMQLTKTYPKDLELKDGTAFWASPKRYPTALEFNPNDPIHVDFVLHAACLWATIFKIPIPSEIDRVWVGKVAQGVNVPKFNFKEGKKIETDPNAKAPAQPQQEDFDQAEFDRIIRDLDSLRNSTSSSPSLVGEKFEKDDDRNHHIDFITATANLRARNYQIEEVDKLRVKRIAGKIIPAIATTTSVVSGLVALELTKIAIGLDNLATYKNAFLNLAIPVFALSEPAPAPKVPITKTAFYTLWDKWEVKGGAEMTLQDFMDWFTKRFGLKVNGVFQGTSIVYAPFFPAHAKRLPQKLAQLVKADPSAMYVDLVATFADEDDKEVNGPDVRFYLK